MGIDRIIKTIIKPESQLLMLGILLLLIIVTRNEVIFLTGIIFIAFCTFLEGFREDREKEEKRKREKIETYKYIQCLIDEFYVKAINIDSDDERASLQSRYVNEIMRIINKGF